MKIAVTDANIFIDLIKLQLLELLFQIGVEIHTTIEVLDELHDYQRAQIDICLANNLLIIYSFSFEELLQIAEIANDRTISIPDATVIFYALMIEAMVLSGDGKLRKYCIEKRIEVHGIIWVFDRLVDTNTLRTDLAAQKLSELLTFNDRLPIQECKKRIQKWSLNLQTEEE